MATHVTQQQIVEALQEIPAERWTEVLHVLKALKSGAPAASSVGPPVRTGADLVGSDLIGIWADRTDITDSRDFARELRHKASHRQQR